jgi:hypothetical protein
MKMALWVSLFRLDMPCEMPSVKCRTSLVIYASLRKSKHPALFESSDRDEILEIEQDFTLISECRPAKTVIAGNTITVKIVPKFVSEKAIRETSVNEVLALHLDRNPVALLSAPRKIVPNFTVDTSHGIHVTANLRG